jgi:hypothetical protein
VRCGTCGVKNDDDDGCDDGRGEQFDLVSVAERVVVQPCPEEESVLNYQEDQHKVDQHLERRS